jgi:hypothetical protein
MRAASSKALLGVMFLAAAFASGVGCTFLISFDDMPKKDAGAAPTDTTTSPQPTDTEPTSVPTTTTPTTTATTPPPDASVSSGCDRSLDLSRLSGCEHFAVPNAQICADNIDFAPYPYPGPASRDLVTCNAGSATCVQHCSGACAHLPDGVPDECDPCIGKTDGAYCGSELAWGTKGANVLIHCSRGAMSTSPGPQSCPTTCIAGGGAARCS